MEDDAKKAKKAKKEAKKARKRAKKEAKRAAKRARKERKSGSSSSSSSSDDEGGPAPLPAAARWQPSAAAPAAPSLLRADDYPTLGRRSTGGAIMPLRQSEAESGMRELRAARFEQTAAQQALAAAASRPVAPLPAGQVLRGESQALEKSYLRLTAMPRADQAKRRTHAAALAPSPCARNPPLGPGAGAAALRAARGLCDGRAALAAGARLPLRVRAAQSHPAGTPKPARQRRFPARRRACRPRRGGLFCGSDRT